MVTPETLVAASVIVYIVALTLYTVRVVKGPTIPDRILAVDALTYDLAALIAVIGLLLRSPLLVPSAIVLSLWVYALDLYVAKYLEGRELGD